MTPKRNGYTEPQLSPDGKQLLVHRGQATTIGCLALRSRNRRVDANDIGRRHFSLRWSPDAKQISFSSNRNGPYNVFLMPSDASAPARQLTRNQNWTDATSWSADGKTLLASWHDRRPDTTSWPFRSANLIDLLPWSLPRL